MIRAIIVISLIVHFSCLQAVNAEPLKVPFLPQKKNGCGAAIVVMLMRYWESQPVKYQLVTSSPDRIYRQLYDAKRRGISLADMKRYLEQSGYAAFTLRGQWSDVQRHLAKGRPIIISLANPRSKMMHFAVVIGAEGNRVWLNDPTRKSVRRIIAVQNSADGFLRYRASLQNVATVELAHGAQPKVGDQRSGLPERNSMPRTARDVSDA